MAATLEAGPDMTGVNFAAGKAFVISSTSGFVYVYDMKTLKPAGRIKIGTNIQLETATTDTADEKLYLAESTNHAVVIIDAKTHAIERVAQRRPVPVGHAHHGQQGQLLPLIARSGPPGGRAGRRVRALATALCAMHAIAARLRSCRLAAPRRRGIGRTPRASATTPASTPDRSTAVTESQATELTLTLTDASRAARSRPGSARPAPSTRPARS